MFPTEQEWLKVRYKDMVYTTVNLWSDSRRHKDRHIIETDMIHKDERYVNGRISQHHIDSIEELCHDYRVVGRLL